MATRLFALGSPSALVRPQSAEARDTRSARSVPFALHTSRTQGGKIRDIDTGCGQVGRPIRQVERQFRFGLILSVPARRHLGLWFANDRTT
jgi:hypothetical protein